MEIHEKGLINNYLKQNITFQISGWLMDTTGSPDSVFYMAGALLALAGILGYPLRRFKRCRNPDEAEDPYGYHYSSEQEMIETVKMAQYETTM